MYLVRHCDYSNPLKILVGRLPVELSEQGTQHAHALHSYFADKNIQKIYSSAVRRCQQTSEIISNTTIPIEYDQRLLETFSAYQGYWGGVTESGDLDWTDFFVHRNELGGEGAMDIQKRMVSFYTDQLSKTDEETILICSHGDPLYLLYLHLIGKKDISDVDIHGELPDYQPKGSIRIITLDDSNAATVSDLIDVR